MREQYIKMRIANDFDFGWFYQYYISEFPNIPKNWVNKHGQTLERELIPAQHFFQAFQMTFAMYAFECLEFLDKKFEVVKVESSDGKLITML